MRIRDPQAEAEEPFNLVPLMDMAFNLLIFFMAATSFTQIETDMRVQLPRIAPHKATAEPPHQLVINIRQDGSTVIAGKSYTQADLGPFVQSQLKSDPNRVVLIRADERSVMRFFAEVATICRKAGVSELKIGFLQTPDEKPR
ncbi:MAG TPA: biopolymer transporter ExbD [Tepidisphaeraceae bacterium]|nr:biopolymer transporter ExbD [Tepidisphaeraceae bacterium]